MIRQRFEFTGHRGAVLAAVIWQPEQEVKAVLQITHGMTEHLGRYESLAMGSISPQPQTSVPPVLTVRYSHHT